MDPARVTAIPLFAGLSGPALDAVCASVGEYRVDAGTTLATEGDFGHGFFAIEAGTADVVREGAVLARLGPGDVFGEIALLTSGRRTASVVATSEMRLLTLFKRDLWRLEERAPEVAEALRQTVRARLERAPAQL